MPMEANRSLLIHEMARRLKIIEDVAPMVWHVHSRMDKRHPHNGLRHRQGTQPIHVVIRDVLARPENGLRRRRMKIRKVLLKRHIVVVVSTYDRSLELVSHDPDAFRRTGIVAHNITSAHPVSNTLFGGISQHDVHGVDVGVNIAENTVYFSH